MIYLPGYGLYPASWLRRAGKARFQGQASREMLEAENMGDAPPKVPGGWHDYAGPKPTPGGAHDMSDNEVPLHMLVTGPTLKELLLDSLNAAGGVYRPVGGEWRFFLDPVLRVKLALAGLPAPCSVRAEPLVCLRTPPPLPTLGGFIHPGVGVYCRPAGIPAGLEQRYRVVLSRASTFGMADAPGALQKAEQAGVAFNRSLGIAGKNKPRWWLYTLPRVTAAGAPEVAVGIAGDVAMDRELPASFAGVSLVQEIAYPKQGMGSAPIDTVWPTDSPDYHEPTGDATGDDDPAIGCIKESGMGSGGSFVTLADLASSGLNVQDPSWGDDGAVKSMPKDAGTILIREIDGETVQSMPAGSATMDADPYEDNDYSMGSLAGERDGSVQIMPPETFSGQGCPIVAMPSGGLNRGVPTGYEGQAWVNKDWNMGDMAGAVRETRKLLTPTRLLGACLGATAGFVAVRKFAKDGTPPGHLATTVAAAVGAVSGLLAANAAVTALEG